jgi:SAM-dependent methyltransferase
MATTRHWLDCCTQHYLEGWSTAPFVVLAINDGPIARIVPDRPRPDLIDAGIGLGHGFGFFLPQPLWLDDDVSLHGPDGSVFRTRLQASSAARIAELTRHVDPARKVGLEIGALDKPLLPKHRFRVFTLDQASRQDLVPRYQDHAVHLPALAEPDFVTGARTIPEVVGAKRFDYCVASHVIEHVPDMIGWLWQIWAVLQEDGVLSLAVPHAEHSFDKCRQLTTLADLAESFFARATQPGTRQIIDAILGDALYAKTDVLAAAFKGFHLANHARKAGLYCDTHCTVFTPASFAEVLLCLDRCELLGFDLLGISESGIDEFFVHLRKNPAKILPDHISP